MAIKIPKQQNTFKIEPSMPENTNLLGEDRKLNADEIRSKFTALDFNREQQAENLQTINKIFTEEPELANTFYGDNLKTSETFKGIGNYFWNELSLTKVLKDNALNFGVADQDILTEDEWKKSDYYREGMKFPKYKIGLAEAMEMAKIYDENKEFKTIENLASPLQKVSRFVGSIGAGLLTDPVTTLATGGIGSTGTSIMKAMFIAGSTNFIADELIYQINKDPLANAGITKTQEERNFERGMAFLGGAGFEGLIKGLGKVYNRYKSPKQTKSLQETYNEIKTQVENEYVPQTIETKPLARVSDIIRESKKDKEFFKKFLNDELTPDNFAGYGFTKESLQNQIENLNGKKNLTTAQTNILQKYNNAVQNLPSEEQKNFLKVITENPEIIKKIEQKQITPAEYSNLGFTEEFANATLQKRNANKKLETAKQVDAETLRRIRQYLKQQTRNGKQTFKKVTAQERADKVNAIMQGKEQLEALRKANATEFKNASDNTKRNKSNQTIENEFLPTELDIPEIGNIKVEYEIVPRKDLIYSNNAEGDINPLFPLKYQPRDRRKNVDEIGYRNILTIANNLDTNKLFKENGGLQSGSPLILDNGVVIAGNGRMMALEMAYRDNKAGNYKSELERLFPQSNASQIEDPILIRRIISALDDEEIKTLSLKANDSPTDSYSAMERIKLNANIIEERDLMKYYKGGDLNSEQNTIFFKEFFQNVAPTKLKEYIYNGQLTNAGILDLESAITQVAYKDDTLTSNIHVVFEDEISKTLVSALKDFAPRIAKIKDKIRNGEINPDYDISKNFAEAFNIYYISNNTKFLAEQLNSSGGLFEFQINPITEVVLRSFFKDEINLDKILNKNDLLNFFENYWGTVEKTKTAGLMEGLMKEKTAIDILKESKIKESKIAVFDFQEQPRPVESGIIMNEEVTKTINELYSNNKIESANNLNIDNNKINSKLSKTEVLAREDVRFGYAKDLTSEIKKALADEELKLGRVLTKDEETQFYKQNADVINIAVFGMRAKEFRELYPNVSQYAKMLNQRDFASGNELLVVGKLQEKLGKMIDEYGLTGSLEKYPEIIKFSDDLLSELNIKNPKGTKRPDVDAFEVEILKMKDELEPKLFDEWVSDRARIANELNLAKVQEFLSCMNK